MVCTFNNYNALVGEDSQETNINVNQSYLQVFFIQVYEHLI